MIRQLAVFLFLSFSAIAIAHPSWGLAIDAQGNLYIPDIVRNGRGTLWMLTPEKQLIALAKDFHCHNVNVVPGKGVFAAHGEDIQRLVRWTEGTAEILIEERDINQFFGGNCAVSPNGKIYFSIDHYIWQRFPDGRITKASDQYLEWNQALFVDEDECIYVPDIGINGGVLYRLSPGGNSDKLATNLISDVGRPRDRHNDVLLGMTKDGTGNVYICELAGGKIIRIGDDGGKDDFYTSSKGWIPVSICFRDDSAFIVECGRDHIDQTRVILVGPDGRATVFFEFP